MKDIIENAPKIIAEAAKSPLGIAALLILVTSMLAWMFFGESQDSVKAVIFGAILIVFLVIIIFSFRYSNPPHRQANQQPKEPATGKMAQQEKKTLPEINEELRIIEVEWNDLNNKNLRHRISIPEADILETMKGKPDVRWDRDVILNFAYPKSSFNKNILSLAIDNLEKKQYLSVSNDGRYALMALAIDYYRATDTRAVHEIDEAEYWEGT